MGITMHSGVATVASHQVDDAAILALLREIALRMASKARDCGFRGALAVAWMGPAREVVAIARGCDELIAGGDNYYAIAQAKIAEMCDTLRASGDPGRIRLHGELGYLGGEIVSFGGGHVLAAFTGVSGEDDQMVARHGLACCPASGCPDHPQLGRTRHK